MTIRKLEPSLAHAYLSQVNNLELDDLISLIGYFSELARDSMEILRRAMVDYRAAAHTLATYGLRASAKDALESADYIEAFLKGAGQ